jgi:hypothetical protein
MEVIQYNVPVLHKNKQNTVLSHDQPCNLPTFSVNTKLNALSLCLPSASVSLMGIFLLSFQFVLREGVSENLKTFTYIQSLLVYQLILTYLSVSKKIDLLMFFCRRTTLDQA